MPFAPEEIEGKTFLPRMRGYDREEVAAFLRSVADDYRSALSTADEAAVAGMDASGGAAVLIEAARQAVTAAELAAELHAEVLDRFEALEARERALEETEQRVAADVEGARAALCRAREELVLARRRAEATTRVIDLTAPDRLRLVTAAG